MKLSTIRSTVVRTLLPAAVLYSIALLWSGSESISAELVLRDLAQSCDAPLGQGFLSSVGYLLWMAAAAIALFAASTRQIQGPVAYRQFAYCGGGFTSPMPFLPGCCFSNSEAHCNASLVILFCWR